MRRKFARAGFLARRAEEDAARAGVERLRVRTPSVEQRVGNHLRNSLVEFAFIIRVPVDGDGSRFILVRAMTDCRNRIRIKKRVQKRTRFARRVAHDFNDVSHRIFSI